MADTKASVKDVIIVTPATFPCSLCDRSFVTFGGRCVHLECHKKYYKQCAAPDCLLKFSSKGDYLSHREDKHNKKK